MEDLNKYLQRGLLSYLFPSNLELLPGISEIYELELALLESKILQKEEIIKNGAFFARVDDRFTRHYLMCKGEPIKLPYYSSTKLKDFFQKNQFKTGYATHGLFPYRGKFHPQMIKALINIMGLKPGDIILDPMMGSGTVLIEARLMGIRSIGVDISPFCRFMTQVKLEALTISTKPIINALKNSEKVFSFFEKSMSFDGNNYFEDSLADQLLASKTDKKLDEKEIKSIFNFLSLAYLDSVGYSERSKHKSHYEQFKAILERYLFVVEKIQRSLKGSEKELGEATALEGDARCIPLDDTSIDGIIFSPPYSFAIDYLKNDLFHLKYLGAKIEDLQKNMIGVRGERLIERYRLYISDMKEVFSECARVLKKGKFCTIVIGTNSNQLSRILGQSVDRVQGLDEIMVEIAKTCGFNFVQRIKRQINGISNTMRTEYIIIFQRI